MTGFISETFEEIRESGTARCQLCPEGDCEVGVEGVESIGGVLDAMHDHGVEAHGLPDDEPWSDELLEEHSDAEGTG